jgi:hypothetical protein
VGRRRRCDRGSRKDCSADRREGKQRHYLIHEYLSGAPAGVPLAIQLAIIKGYPRAQRQASFSALLQLRDWNIPMFLLEMRENRRPAHAERRVLLTVSAAPLRKRCTGSAIADPVLLLLLPA